MMGGREKILLRILDFGRCTAKEIAAYFGVAYKLTLKEIHDLQAEGLVKRQYVKQKGLNNAVRSGWVLTDKGRDEAMRILQEATR